MFKWVGLIKKRKGLSTAEFVDYYENRHVPLLMQLFPQWKNARLYRRNYLKVGESVVENVDGGPRDDGPGFDVITEVMFETRAEADALLNAAFNDSDNFAKVRADEDNFIEPGHIAMYVVEVRETFSDGMPAQPGA